MPFTTEQENVLTTYFKDSEKVTLGDARSFLNENKELFEGRSEKMIQDKWINMRKKLKQI